MCLRLKHSGISLRDKRKNACTIVPASGFHSKVLPVPGNAGCFDIISDQVNASNDGTLTPEDWTKDGGYTAYSPAYKQDTAFQKPDPTGKGEYLKVPKGIRKELKKVLDLILEKHKSRKLSDQDIAGLIVSYFMNNYKYKILEYESNDIDPIINFLTNSKQGHCELFASAMTLLLRRKGIPARYVTGFVCVDQHPSKRYFATRVGNGPCMGGRLYA